MKFNHGTRKNVDSEQHDFKTKCEEKLARRNLDIGGLYARQEYIDALEEVGTQHQRNKRISNNEIKASNDLQGGNQGNNLTRLGSSRRGFDTNLMEPQGFKKDGKIREGIIMGENTKLKKSQGSLAGVSLDRFIPMVPCVAKNVQNVPIWDKLGESTRTYYQNSNYLQKCGK